ncbi:hypothetical protein DPMN_030762 [Dreissena polymorpha]|uniref:Uncharacterized protein n=1 Tax=Dreissena polymorpha TaxID=45954 RepID=A0A9D4RIL7_DREPO|nr:hypothetical protein DPMN_030762 [Dreissena polymorpha]
MKRKLSRFASFRNSTHHVISKNSSSGSIVKLVNCLEGGIADLLLDNEKIVTVPAELLILALPSETHDVDQLTVGGPVIFNLKQTGSEITSVSLAE